MVRILIVAFSLLFFLDVNILNAQIGGSSSFNYLRIPNNAPLVAVGGMNVSIRSINMIMQNPAIISKEMSKTLSLSNQMYYAGINTTSLSYVHSLGKLPPIGINLQYYTSGNMTQYDATGAESGTYSARQYYVTAGTSHTIDYYTLGVNIKYAGSNIAGYGSSAALVDIGGLFKHPTQDFTVGLVLQNMGIVLQKYSDIKQTLPFDVQLGTSYKLEHMPFRISLLAHNLHQFDIVYLDPYKKQPLDANGQPLVVKKSTGDKILRHFTIGGEFFLGKFLSLKVGYNHLVRREMRTETRNGMAGFAMGAVITVKAFEIAYSRDWQHVAGGFNTFTINTNFARLLTKKTVTPAAY